MTVRIHRVGHERAHVLDLPGPARIEERRVQIQIGVRPLDGCAPQRFYGPIEPLRDPRLTVERPTRSPSSASVTSPILRCDTPLT